MSRFAGLRLVWRRPDKSRTRQLIQIWRATHAICAWRNLAEIRLGHVVEIRLWMVLPRIAGKRRSILVHLRLYRISLRTEVRPGCIEIRSATTWLARAPAIG